MVFYECSMLELLAGKFFARSPRVHDPGGVRERRRATCISSIVIYRIHNIIERKQVLMFAFDSFVICTILSIARDSSYPGVYHMLSTYSMEKGVHAARRPEKWERIEVIYAQNPSRNPVCSIIHCWMSRWCVIEWLLKASQKCREWHRN